MCIARHVQSTQNNKFAISLQYLKENVKDKVFADKHQRFLQNDIIILGVWSGMPKLPKITSLRAFSFYVFIKRPKFALLLHPCTCLILVPPPPYCKRLKLYINPLPPPITKILNSVNFILFHKQWLESALINARKNYLLI